MCWNSLTQTDKQTNTTKDITSFAKEVTKYTLLYPLYMSYFVLEYTHTVIGEKS